MAGMISSLSLYPSPRTVARVSAGRRHVLVVEDDSPIRSMLTDLLQDAGYAVAEAADGREALKHLQERRADLIVLDLMLPRMSGWDFLTRSRQLLEDSNIPVLVLSAISGRGDYPATLGVAAWFTKPLDVPRFLGAVEQMAGPSRPLPQPGPAVAARAAARVLVVEDEAPIRDLLIEHLEEQGYAPQAAVSIDEANACLAENGASLILLDLMLPGASGWTFLRQRREEPTLAAIPVLVLSAAPQERLLEAKQLGADAFLSKPFDLDVLSALLRSFVGPDSADT
jgi:DNA-binding response OmpR family regulator